MLGAFNPGLTRLPNGNLLLMVRVAEALREPISTAKSTRSAGIAEHGYGARRLAARARRHRRPAQVPCCTAHGWKIMALTSLSWLLPVELTPDGSSVVEIHYDRRSRRKAATSATASRTRGSAGSDGRWLMTTCSVSPERHSTTLYSSDNGLDWTFEGIVLDHQNKDMLIFEGLIGGKYWAQTRPLGDALFRLSAGQRMARRPLDQPRQHVPTRCTGSRISSPASARTRHRRDRADGRRHAADPDRDRRQARLADAVARRSSRRRSSASTAPTGRCSIRTSRAKVIATSHAPLLEANPELTAPLEDQMYLRDVVFTTGIADAGDHFIVARGEADLACRITHVPRSAFDS